jgi:hypothetical protein
MVKDLLIKKFLFTLVLLTSFVFFGCVERKVLTTSKLSFGTKEQKNYAPVVGGQLKLELCGDRVLHPGRGGKIAFKLTNIDNKVINIPEWYVNESYNIIVYCQIWLPNQRDPDETMWIPIEPEIKHPVNRYPLQLPPGAFVVIETKLPFVDKLVVSPGAERRYFVKAQLNLKSAQATCYPSSFSVRRWQPPKKTAPRSNRDLLLRR